MKRRAVIAGLAALPLSVACGGVGGGAKSTTGRLIALDSSFKQLWEAESTASNLGMAAPASAERIVVQYGDGVLQALDSAGGRPAWTRRTQVSGITYRPIPVDNGNVFVLDEVAVSLAMLRSSDGSIAWSQSADVSGQIAVSATAGIVAVAGIAGATAYSLDSGDTAWTQPVGQCLGVTADADRVYLATVQRELMAIDAHSGKTAWTQTVDDTFGSIEVVGGRLFLVEGIVSDRIQQRIRAYDPMSGRASWEILVPETARSIPSTPSPVAAHGNVYLFGEERQLIALNPITGAPKWEGPKPTRPAAWGGMIAANDKTVFLALDNSVTGFDPETGRQIGRHSFESKGNTVLVSTTPDRVFVSAFGRPGPHRD